MIEPGYYNIIYDELGKKEKSMVSGTGISFYGELANTSWPRI
jgi:hypothetical protein